MDAGQYPDICRARLAEALEKIMKAELIRLGWPLRKTHELEVLVDELRARGSDLVSEIEPLATDLAAITALAESIPARIAPTSP